MSVRAIWPDIPGAGRRRRRRPVTRQDADLLHESPAISVSPYCTGKYSTVTGC